MVAQSELSQAQEQLDAKQRELDEAQALYDAAMREKQELLDDAQACRRKMANATALIDGLGGEKVGVWGCGGRGGREGRGLFTLGVLLCVSVRVLFQVRWTESSALFQTQIKHLVGDVLLATGFLSYAGPFNQEYRNLLLTQWRREMTSNHIPYSDVRLLVLPLSWHSKCQTWCPVLYPLLNIYYILE